jgi:hypothetical protein
LHQQLGALRLASSRLSGDDHHLKVEECFRADLILEIFFSFSSHFR